MKIYLGGFYRLYRPEAGEWLEVQLPGRQPLRQVLLEQGIPPAEVHLAVVNRQQVELDSASVEDGDEVRLYPPVGGG